MYLKTFKSSPMEELAELIEAKCQFLKDKIRHLDGNYLFSPSFVVFEKDIKTQGEQFPIGNIISRKINWKERIKNLIKSGFSSLNSINALTPNKSEDAEYFLIGKIYFNSNSNIGGEIDFIRKYLKGVLLREYLLCFYTFSYKNDKYRMVEETVNWEEGIKLIAISICDFERKPESFINERIIKWQTKEPL